ncbi:hypothetical protein [Sinorhizobium psoraleae]|uniref:Uncharacterized protein n=1 Tax=Sinorhizobium psoraleae TaxID=520838 RepID=A0ABT4KAI2_9HYPH|nr:hypothetical protein [Sinorhizobium psoraleae]MCZ4088830.1 hypothetical protein [Sinorhizobium psoraleae]
MRVSAVKLLPYVKPGDEKMGDMIRELAGRYAAVLLANHGSRYRQGHRHGGLRCRGLEERRSSSSC